MVKDYGHLLRLDAGYAAKAKRIAELARDPVEVVAAEWTRIAPKVAMDMGSRKVAFHSPCTLQHGMKLKGRVEEILHALGLELTNGPGRAPLLRLGRHLLDPAAGALGTVQGEQARGAGIGRARSHRDGEHRLPRPSRRRRELPGAALDRAARRADGRRLPGAGLRHPAPTSGRVEAERAGSRAAYRRFLAIPTRWMDNDSYGHINNVTYYSYFDTAVNEHLIRAGGLDIRNGQEVGLRRRDDVPVHEAADVSGNRRRRAARGEARNVVGDATRSASFGRATTSRRRPANSSTSGSIARRSARCRSRRAIRAALEPLRASVAA